MVRGRGGAGSGGESLSGAALPVADEVGGEDEPTGPLRRCIATGAVRPKAELIRFVAGPDGTVVPDLAGRLPGRGLWVSAEAAALAKAAKKNLFARAARMPVRVPDGLVGRVEAQLRQSCIDLVGMARRAGQAVAGYEKVRARLAEGRVAVLLAARDGAADGKGKIAALAAGVTGGRPVVDVLTADQLGLAFGRDRVVHGALAPGGLSARLLAESARLSGVEGGIREPTGVAAARPETDGGQD